MILIPKPLATTLLVILGAFSITFGVCWIVYMAIELPIVLLIVACFYGFLWWLNVSVGAYTEGEEDSE